MTLPATTPRLGHGAYIGIGSPAAFGTNGTQSDIVSYWAVDEAADNLNLERDLLEFNDLTAPWKLSDLVKAGRRRVTGSVTLKCTWSGLQDILRFLVGHNVSPTTSAPYTYAFVSLVPSGWWHLSNNRGLCIEMYRGGGLTNSVFYQGCVITELSFKFESNNYVELAISFIGRGYTIGTRSAPTFPCAFETDFMVTPTGQSGSGEEFFQMKMPSGSLTEYTCRSCTVTINTGVDAREDVTSIETLLPYPTEKMSVKLDAEWELGPETTPEVSITYEYGHARPILHVKLPARPTGDDAKKVAKVVVRLHVTLKNLWS